MSLDQHIYGSTDWHLPSPSSTPKSVNFPDSSFKTPKAEGVPQLHFLDAWSTPRVNGHYTPAQTPSFTISTPIERPSSSYSQTRTPEDPEFHVNHFIPTSLPLPPVDPSRRLSSSPGPFAVNRNENRLRENPNLQRRPVSMDMSQMQTPPPTRDATSRRGQQQRGGHEFATPATVVQRTPGQVQTQDGLFNQTPFGFPALQFSPDMLHFPSTGPMSAPALPHSRLFWDQPPTDGNGMDVDMPIASDPFGPTPHKIEGNLNWQTFHTPNQMNQQAFQALHGMSSPGPITSFAMSSTGAPEATNSRPNSFLSTSGVVDPSMLFSFSSPGPSSSFGTIPPKNTSMDNRQPYETQVQESRREKEMAKKTKSQHSRTNTSSSTASAENTRPGLQRSNTDSGFRKSRPSSMESKSSGPAQGYHIPRRSSPLKRQSGGSLMAIPEIRRPRTRLVIDSDGRARTETVPAEDDARQRDSSRESQRDMRKQYPQLWADEDSESESDEPVTLSRNTSFTLPPQRRVSKHARQESGDLQRSNSFKMPRPASGVFDKSSFETIRPVKKADNPFRRYSMMDFPSSFGDAKENADQQMTDSAGDALGALKKVVEGRQKRSERSSQNTLQAHNQRWAQASAEIVNHNSSPQGLYDPYSNSFSASPATTNDAGLTPSTDRSSLSSESTRCICNSADDGRPMVQCESCTKWLHMACVGLNNQNLPPVFVCIFCTGSTPVARGGRVRGPLPQFDSPLTHKSVFRR
ncbi:hypothetical protein BCR34DRAFT_486645 [Clohesyomyces aquaticus]|uniref:PHD-type domain-containing protein n=1 Tax=Clohesyomyces aquaticus TaxID=1231657 RepID=A0A1Y1ZHY2_9PLEO|nr:hypothetical protein BCR34DRAFT_486645 [Clohesyomyces aquaticus]